MPNPPAGATVSQSTLGNINLPVTFALRDSDGDIVQCQQANGYIEYSDDFTWFLGGNTFSAPTEEDINYQDRVLLGYSTNLISSHLLEGWGELSAREFSVTGGGTVQMHKNGDGDPTMERL